MRVNVGCGPNPTNGWENIDASPSVLLGKLPRPVLGILRSTGLLTAEREAVAANARDGAIHYGRATHLPFADGTVQILYSSHMLEHLDRTDARRFLAECRRVLAPGGWLRLVVPDLRHYVEQFEIAGDADAFLDSLRFGPKRRDHKWMYDASSLRLRVEAAGFVDIWTPPAGRTRLSDPGELDLCERASDSIYLEARAPFTNT